MAKETVFEDEFLELYEEEIKSLEAQRVKDVEYIKRLERANENMYDKVLISMELGDENGRLQEKVSVLEAKLKNGKSELSIEFKEVEKQLDCTSQTIGILQIERDTLQKENDILKQENDDYKYIIFVIVRGVLMPLPPGWKEDFIDTEHWQNLISPAFKEIEDKHNDRFERKLLSSKGLVKPDGPPPEPEPGQEPPPEPEPWIEPEPEPEPDEDEEEFEFEESEYYPPPIPRPRPLVKVPIVEFPAIEIDEDEDEMESHYKHPRDRGNPVNPEWLKNVTNRIDEDEERGRHEREKERIREGHRGYTN